PGTSADQLVFSHPYKPEIYSAKDGKPETYLIGGYGLLTEGASDFFVISSALFHVLNETLLNKFDLRLEDEKVLHVSSASSELISFFQDFRTDTVALDASVNPKQTPSAKD